MKQVMLKSYRGHRFYNGLVNTADDVKYLEEEIFETDQIVRYLQDKVNTSGLRNIELFEALRYKYESNKDKEHAITFEETTYNVEDVMNAATGNST